MWKKFIDSFLKAKSDVDAAQAKLEHAANATTSYSTNNNGLQDSSSSMQLPQMMKFSERKKSEFSISKLSSNDLSMRRLDKTPNSKTNIANNPIVSNDLLLETEAEKENAGISTISYSSN
jgi:hypothetical protein